MEIKQVTEQKRDYLDLLLLADEQEDMLNRYLDRGDMFVLFDGGVRAECVVTKEAEGIYELKNLATVPAFQGQGYGQKLVRFLFSHYTDCRVFFVGTGDSTLTIPFCFIQNTAGKQELPISKQK